MKKLLTLSVIAIFLLSACTTVEEKNIEPTGDEEVVVQDTTVEGYPNWELTGGTLPYPEPGLIFEGDEVIEGWVVYVPFYVGEEIPHFRVAEQSQVLIPYESKTYDFILIKEDPEDKWGKWLEEEEYEPLKEYSEENPAKIRINKLLYSMEGSGKMQIVEIVE